MQKSWIWTGVLVVGVWFVLVSLITRLGINFVFGIVGVIVISLGVSIGILVLESRGSNWEDKK